MLGGQHMPHARGSVALEILKSLSSPQDLPLLPSFLPPALAYYRDLSIIFHFFSPIFIWFVHPTANISINSPLVICLFLLLMPLQNFFLIAPHHSFSLFLALCVSHPLLSIKPPPPSTESLAGSKRSDKQNRQLLLLVSTLGITVVVLDVDS